MQVFHPKKTRALRSTLQLEVENKVDMIRQELQALEKLAQGNHELAMLRYLLGMAIEEADARSGGLG